MTIKQADLVKKLLAALEKNYGKASLFLAEEPMDQVVYHIIEGGSGKKAAETGVSRLRKIFVDWNEVRVSSDREIEGCLSEVRKDDRAAVAANVKAGLDYLFEARYREELILGEEFEDQDRALHFLAEIEGLDHGRAALVLFSNRPEEVALIPFPSIGRILMRVGAIRKTTSAKAVIASVIELVEEKELGRLTFLLARHGHDVCGIKSYYCTQCKAASLCSMGRRRVKNAKTSRKSAAKRTGRAAAGTQSKSMPAK